MNEKRPKLELIASNSFRKGLSKGLVDHPFQAKNEYCLPAPFTKSVQEAIDNYSLYVLTSEITFSI